MEKKIEGISKELPGGLEFKKEKRLEKDRFDRAINKLIQCINYLLQNGRSKKDIIGFVTLIITLNDYTWEDS